MVVARHSRQKSDFLSLRFDDKHGDSSRHRAAAVLPCSDSHFQALWLGDKADGSVTKPVAAYQSRRQRNELGGGVTRPAAASKYGDHVTSLLLCPMAPFSFLFSSPHGTEKIRIIVFVHLNGSS
jgi:hypothetical protein